MLRVSLAVFALLLLPLPGIAEDEPPPCSAPEHRQFDFWIGDWDVHDPEGTLVGHNRIDRILDGCALQESWTGAKGSRGHSYNIFADGRWHQTWVDSRGRLLLLDGGLEDGRMVLEGETAGPDDATLTHRITWEELTDGRVRQHWTISEDRGQTWQDAFVGLYSRRSES